MSDSSDIEEEVYTVERIVKKRIKNGIEQYLLKWEGYTAEECTWENIHDMNCPDLISEFEQQEYQKRQVEKRKKEDKTNKRQLIRKEGTKEKRAKGDDYFKTDGIGFEVGDKCEDILGARMFSDELYLYCSWEGKKPCSFVPARIANVKIPQQVIAFYESKLRFEPMKEDKEDIIETSPLSNQEESVEEIKVRNDGTTEPSSE